MNRLLFLPALLIGLIIGLAAGYVAYKIGGGPLNFHGWIANAYSGHPLGALVWAIAGILVAVIATYRVYKS